VEEEEEVVVVEGMNHIEKVRGEAVEDTLKRNTGAVGMTVDMVDLEVVLLEDMAEADVDHTGE
jgi:5S rRNA maturation endonuclease (ribonuclease M5)